MSLVTSIMYHEDVKKYNSISRAGKLAFLFLTAAYT